MRLTNNQINKRIVTSNKLRGQYFKDDGRLSIGLSLAKFGVEWREAPSKE